MAGARLQQEEEQLLSSCLGLLDIKQAEGAKLVDISPAMFRKPNPKAFELILYHTYCVTKGKAAAKKNLRGLWPVPDKDQKLRKDFYQKITEWLKEAGREQSTQAFQRNPSGPKVVSFLFDLAKWALEVQHARMFADDVVEQPTLEDSALLVSLAEPLVAAAEANNQLQAERLLQLCSDMQEYHQRAEETAAQLKERYYELTAQLREAHTQEGEAGLQPPSIRLASILPADLSFSTDSLEAAARSCMAVELLQQQQEVQQVWQLLQQYMQDFGGLSSMVQHLVGSAAHPYAIDAVQLRAYGQAGGLEGMAAAPAAALDIAALVEAWLFDVGSVCRYVKTLAGYTANLEQQQDNQQRGWLPIRPGGIGRCSFMSPLVATSDAASHATHLYAQLSLHRACRDGLLGLKCTLKQHADEAAARMQALEAELGPLYEQQIRQAELEAAAVEGAAAADAAAFSAVHADAGGLHSAASADWSQGGSGLFAGGHMQLIPPTPLLQQQVAKQQRMQQHRAADPQGHLPAHGSNLQQAVPPLPLLSHGKTSVTAAAAAGSGSDEVLSPVLLPEAGHSPEVDSPHSSASSAERPAAELLMSRELMDLDFVDDDPEELDDGGVFSTQQHAFGMGPGRGRSPAGAEMARISFARFSLGSDSLSPILAASRQQGQDAGGAGGLLGVAAQNMGHVLERVGEDEVSEGAEGGESWRSFSIGGQPSMVSQGASSIDVGPQQQQQQQQQQQGSGDDTPTVDWGNPAAAAADQVEPPPAAAAAAAAGSAASPVLSGASGINSTASSPSTQQPLAADPMAPCMSAGSAECLSSAKPRRLTFAAAASVGSHSTTSLLTRGYETQLLDTASSLSISSGDEGGEAVDSAVGQQQQAALATESSAMAALRQRFANAKMPNK